MEDSSRDFLMFRPLRSVISVDFWYALVRFKLDVLRLDEQAQPLQGFYTLDKPSDIELTTDSLHSTTLPTTTTIAATASAGRKCTVTGSLKIFNTLEGFTELDKPAYLRRLGLALLEDMCLNPAKFLANPTLLLQMHLIAYIDLKKSHFKYWVGYPVFLDGKTYVIDQYSDLKLYFTKVYNRPDLASTLWAALKRHNNDQQAFKHGHSPFCILKIDTTDAYLQIHPLSIEEIAAKERIVVLYFEGLSMTEKETPTKAAKLQMNSQLRNFLSFLRLHFHSQLKHLDLIRIGNVPSTQDLGILRLDMSLDAQKQTHLQTCPQKNDNDCIETKTMMKTPMICSLCTDVTGWERDPAGKLRSRLLDLSAYMDPLLISQQSVSLNLKLIQWRLHPTLDLDRISGLKALVIGAGTLGSNIARGLLAWNVLQITFIDSAVVSPSNPVRQSLYTYKDVSGHQIGAINSIVYKAEIAARALREIHPCIETRGIVLEVPMPGHGYQAKEARDKQVEAILELNALIKEHDIVYLLTDTRESRWLPTVLCQVNRRPAMSVAIGFDSFVVVRHGIEAKKIDSASHVNLPTKLGCYFCSDVIGPSNTTNNRTMDQQCTVSRPGLAYLASGLAVEISISSMLTTSEPQQQHADDIRNQPASCVLGTVPHQVRGFLNTYTFSAVNAIRAYDKCTGCSIALLQKVATSSGELDLEFLMDLLDHPQILEDVTGITSMKQDLALQLDDLELVCSDEDNDTD